MKTFKNFQEKTLTVQYRNTTFNISQFSHSQTCHCRPPIKVMSLVNIMVLQVVNVGMLLMRALQSVVKRINCPGHSMTSSLVLKPNVLKETNCCSNIRNPLAMERIADTGLTTSYCPHQKLIFLCTTVFLIFNLINYSVNFVCSCKRCSKDVLDDAVIIMQNSTKTCCRCSNLYFDTTFWDTMYTYHCTHANWHNAPRSGNHVLLQAGTSHHSAACKETLCARTVQKTLPPRSIAHATARLRSNWVGRWPG